MNQWNGIVRLVADVDYKFLTESGTGIATFTGAVDKHNAKELKAQGKQSANFIRFKAFGKTAENIAKFFSKGDQIGITGEISTGSYDKDGETRYTTDVVVNRFTFIGNNQSKSDSKNNGIKDDDDYSFDYQKVDDDFESDVPF